MKRYNVNIFCGNSGNKEKYAAHELSRKNWFYKKKMYMYIHVFMTNNHPCLYHSVKRIFILK